MLLSSYGLQTGFADSVLSKAGILSHLHTQIPRPIMADCCRLSAGTQRIGRSRPDRLDADELRAESRGIVATVPRT
jgi:hypothetical protein